MMMVSLIFTLLTASLMADDVLIKDPDYTPQAGEEIAFDVFRGSTGFGSHVIRFDRNGDSLVTDTTIRLRAGLGPITVFRYEHDAREEWRDGKLVSLESRTLKDGDDYQLDVMRDAESYQIERDVPELSGINQLPAEFLPSSHWHGYGEQLETILNTETGEPMDVEVTYMGTEEIQGDGGTIMADHYRLVSSIVLDLWYDENGRWAGCEFTARDQRIRYVRRFNPASN